MVLRSDQQERALPEKELHMDRLISCSRTKCEEGLKEKKETKKQRGEENRGLKEMTDAFPH